VIFVSHDRYFLNQVATKLLIVEPARFRVINGNYDTYLHFVRQGLARDARAAVAAGASTENRPDSDLPRERAASSKSAKERRKRKYPYRKVPEIEAEIAERESRIDELHQLFASEEVIRDGSRIKQLKAELEEHEVALPKLYEHWEEASEMN
jgi:ATP-binding cassette subfamily F protein 3